MSVPTFTSRTALVTGAARGIGRAIAIALAEAGAGVAVNYRERKDEAERTLVAIEQKGGHGLPCRRLRRPGRRGHGG